MKDSITALMLYLVLFTVLFFFSAYNFLNGVSMVRIGLSAQATNGIILGLSFLGILKTVWHLIRW